MNCPSHCVIFGSKRRSYRELPWRVADFGRLHRYERGGVVHGLARVRSFARTTRTSSAPRSRSPARSSSSSVSSTRSTRRSRFEKIDIKLATRPEKRIGTDELWDAAERRPRRGLERAGLAVRDLARARARSTGRRSSSTSRTRSSAPGSSARSSSTPTCPSASTSSSSARTARSTARSCSTARSSGRSSASSASTSSTAAGASRSGSRPSRRSSSP